MQSQPIDTTREAMQIEQTRPLGQIYQVMQVAEPSELDKQDKLHKQKGLVDGGL